jgi:hypothetical protein
MRRLLGLCRKITHAEFRNCTRIRTSPGRFQNCCASLPGLVDGTGQYTRRNSWSMTDGKPFNADDAADGVN